MRRCRFHSGIRSTFRRHSQHPFRDRLLAILGSRSAPHSGASRQCRQGPGRRWRLHPNRTLSAETPLPSITSTMAELQPPTQPNRELAEMPSPLPSGILEPLAPGLDTSFAGVNFDNNATYNSGYVFIPPDPIAAAGLTHVVSVVNAMIEWRPKSGAAGTDPEPARLLYLVDAGQLTIRPQDNLRPVRRSVHRGGTGTGHHSSHDISHTGRRQQDERSHRRLVVHSHQRKNQHQRHRLLGRLSRPRARRQGDIHRREPIQLPFQSPSAVYGCGSSTRRLSTPVGSRRPRYTTRMCGGGSAASTTQPAHMFGALPANMGAFLVVYSGIDRWHQ